MTPALLARADEVIEQAVGESRRAALSICRCGDQVHAKHDEVKKTR